MDRPLTKRERWALGFHKFLCRNCRRFVGQISMLRSMAASTPIHLQEKIVAGTIQLSTARRETIKRLLLEASNRET
jgi:hypothetical protein